MSTTKSLLVKLKELDEKSAHTPPASPSSSAFHPASTRCRTQRGGATLDDLPQEQQASTRWQLDQAAAERDGLLQELALERARARAWNGLADDSLQFLLRTMSDASAALADPSSLAPWTPADGVPARLESLSNEQRVRHPQPFARSLHFVNPLGHFVHPLMQVRVLKFFVAKLSMFIEERASVESPSFLGDLPLGKVSRIILQLQ